MGPGQRNVDMGPVKCGHVFFTYYYKIGHSSLCKPLKGLGSRQIILNAQAFSGLILQAPPSECLREGADT